MRRGGFRMRALVVGMVMACSFCVMAPAQAYEVRHCVEMWYPKASETEADEQTGGAEECRQHIKKELGPSYVTIEGKGYFFTHEVSSYKPYCRGWAIFDLECWMPGHLQRDSIRETWAYHLVSTRGEQLRKLPLSSRRVVSSRADEFDLYATDGQEVFYRGKSVPEADPGSFELIFPAGDQKATSALSWARDKHRVYCDGKPVPGADPGSFELFSPAGDQEAAGAVSWARDKQRVYYDEGKPIPGAVAGPVNVIDASFVVIGQQVFFLDRWREFHARPEVALPLKILGPGLVSDGKRIYFHGKAQAGLSPAKFEVLAPVCPVPGRPAWPCNGERGPSGDTSFHPILARHGKEVLLFKEWDDASPLAGLKSDGFAYFWFGNEVFALNGGHLAHLRNDWRAVTVEFIDTDVVPGSTEGQP
jgi:hypothetical protein